MSFVEKTLSSLSGRSFASRGAAGGAGHDASFERLEGEEHALEPLSKEATAFAKKHSLRGGKVMHALQELIADATAHEIHGNHNHGHGHGHDGAMPLLSMPEVIQRYGEPQAEVHIGWADIYLDLILVGVAFNGGLLLKHAFYLCVPAGEHPPCLGLPVGLLHVLAFGCPVIFAWLNETVFRSRFEAHALFARGLECAMYLLMIIGASCEEDVTVLQSNSRFWYVFGLCMLGIDMIHVLRYGLILVAHEEDSARKAAKEQICVLIPGTICYLLATLMALDSESADVILDGLTPVLFGVHDAVIT